MPNSKPNKKITKKKQLSINRNLKKKKLTEWSLAVRDRDTACVVCGKKEYLNAHHILPKENYKDLMYEEINGISLCPSHHKFGKYSAHKNPIWFSEFLKKNKNNQYTWAIKNMGDHNELQSQQK